MHARKFLLSHLTASDRQDCSLPPKGGKATSWRWLSRGRGEPRTSHQAQHAHGSANDTSEAAVHCHEPSVLQAKQERSWFMLDSSTAGWSCVCCNPGKGIAFQLNLKDAHSSSQCNQNLSGVFHQCKRHPGTAIMGTTRTSSWAGDNF